MKLEGTCICASSGGVIVPALRCQDQKQSEQRAPGATFPRKEINGRKMVGQGSSFGVTVRSVIQSLHTACPMLLPSRGGLHMTVQDRYIEFLCIANWVALYSNRAKIQLRLYCTGSGYSAFQFYLAGHLRNAGYVRLS